MKDPPRLLEGNDEPARLLAAARSELPDSAQLDALAAKLGVLGGLGSSGAGAGPSAGAGAVPTAAAAATKVGLLVKLGGALLAVTVVGATAAVLTSTRETATVAPVVTAAASTSASTSASTVEELPPPPSLEPTPSAMTAPSAPRKSMKAFGAPEGAGAETAGPDAELQLLERAQDALRTRPAEALALVDEHARRFPHGMLAQEREVIAIEALAKSGRKNDAKVRAAAFKTRFPSSSHARRIDALVGD